MEISILESDFHPIPNAKYSINHFLVTARKRSLGQGNIFSSVCQEFCSQGGVCLSACWDTTPPQKQTPPRCRHPPPKKQTPPQKQTPHRADTPCAVHAGRYGQQAGGMHPTGMQSC